MLVAVESLAAFEAAVVSPAGLVALTEPLVEALADVLALALLEAL